MNFPVIVVPPCQELEAVVNHLYADHLAGRLPVMPRSYRGDLDQLRQLCANPPAYLLEIIMKLDALPIDEVN